MSEDISEQAAFWHVQQDRDDMDWDAFTAWLEADPRHREVFDDIVLLDDRITGYCEGLRDRHRNVPTAPPAFASTTGRPRRRIGGWTASAAAAAIALLAVATLRQADREPVPSTIYRAGAVTRTVALAGGGQVSLAPGSILTAATGDPRHFSVSGRAFFRVTHDPDRQLTVEAGNYRIRDVGTQFDVVTGAGMMRVAVSEGRVAVSPRTGGPELEVAAGRSVTATGGRLTTAPVRPSDVGGWRSGPLVYDGVPLGIVAADVTRVSGRAVVIEPQMAGRAFTGVLAPASGDAMAEALAQLAGLKARREGETIRLGARGARGAR